MAKGNRGPTIQAKTSNSANNLWQKQDFRASIHGLKPNLVIIPFGTKVAIACTEL
jgi:hypothetical protein